MLAHDMRTALGGISGSAALVDPATVPPPTRVHFDRIIASADLLATLLDTLLDVTTMGAEAQQSNVAVFESGRFLRGLTRMWQAEAERKGLRLSASFGPVAPEALRADRTRLTRVIGNLLGNAIKYTDKGSVTLLLDTDAAGRVVFSVEDTGPGLAEDVRERLFEPYVRSRDATKPGTGLGLFIAHTLAAEAGGAVALDGRPGGGCLATVTLPASTAADPDDAPPVRPVPREVPAARPPVEPVRPVAAPPAPVVQMAPPAAPAPVVQALAPAAPVRLRPVPSAAGPAEALSEPQPPSPDLGHLRILMAEDNVTNQLVAGQMLASMSARVEIASDGAEAIEMFDRGNYNLLLVDIEMPRVSGLDVIRHVRSRPAPACDVPVIALTAYAMREHREKIAAAGADGLISKPILGISELGRDILGLIAQRERRLEAAGRLQRPEPAAAGGSPVQAEIYEALSSAIGPAGMAELLGKVEDDLTSTERGLTDGIGRGDLVQIRSRSHVLISVAGAIGATGMQRIAERINKAAHSGDVRAIADLAPEMSAQFARLLAFVAEKRGTA